jgi:DNA-binding GntR family transcriptional regulator
VSDAYEQIRSMIIRGRLAPGARVIETELAAVLQVSRTPVREALRRLQQEGFLMIAPSVSGGPVARTQLLVAPLTRDDLEDAYHLAGALEGLAGRNAAQSATAPRTALAKQLHELTEKLESTGRGNPSEFEQLFELHNSFHELLVAAASVRVKALLAAIRPQLDRYEWMYAPLVGPNYENTYKEHIAIAGAIQRGDADEAERCVRANWNNSAERLSRVVDSLGARGDWRTVQGLAKQA